MKINAARIEQVKMENEEENLMRNNILRRIFYISLLCNIFSIIMSAMDFEWQRVAVLPLIISSILIVRAHNIISRSAS